MTDQSKQYSEAVQVWWAELKENERAMWSGVSPTRDELGAFEIFQRDEEEIRQARSRGSAAGDRAIGKRHNPYDAREQPHLRFYWDWLYDVTWEHR